MTDQEIHKYIQNNRSVCLEDLEKDVINTSPQIKHVHYDNMFDMIYVITQNNKFLFFRKYM